MTDDLGYVDYRTVLDLSDNYKPADVIRSYRKKMKRLVIEISESEVSEEKHHQYLLTMAQLNAGFYILRDRQRGEAYLRERAEVMALEEQWRAAGDSPEKTDALRRRYDQSLRNYLTKYMEELVLEAGRDPDCVEHSGWDAAHERHAARVLRHYRQQRYHQIHERLPYYEITPPQIDWDERESMVYELIDGGAK